MAIIAIFLGGIVGFISATVSMIGYDASFLSAVGVYFTTGLLFATGAIASAMMNEQPTQAPASWKASVVSK